MEVVGGDEAIMEDVLDIGLGGQAVHRGSVVFGAEGLRGGDAEVRVALSEACSCGDGARFGVGGDGGVAVDDEIVVWDDSTREGVIGWGILRVKRCGEDEG